MGIFEKMSGLLKLVQNYPSKSSLAHVSRVRQTVKFGVVRYRRCVRVDFNEQALFLAVDPPLGRHLKLQIPWSEIKNVRSTSLYWLPAVRLSIGDPEVGDVTIYKKLFDQISRYIQTRS